jgi:hypothetical protein
LPPAPTIRRVPRYVAGLFELPLAWFDVQYAGPADPRAYYLLRHAATFLLSLGGVWALFQLGTWPFRDERLGLLAAGLLVLSPRFLSSRATNDKYLVFRALFTLSA